jgi:hypothetical protein
MWNSHGTDKGFKNMRLRFIVLSNQSFLHETRERFVHVVVAVWIAATVLFQAVSIYVARCNVSVVQLIFWAVAWMNGQRIWSLNGHIHNIIDSLIYCSNCLIHPIWSCVFLVSSMSTKHIVHVERIVHPTPCTVHKCANYAHRNLAWSPILPYKTVPILWHSRTKRLTTNIV